MDELIKQYFMSPRKIKSVEPLEGYVLRITFDNGEIKKLYLAQELTGVFEILKDQKKFNRVFINSVGNIAWNIDEQVDSNVNWNNQIDICKDAAYMDSVPV